MPAGPRARLAVVVACAAMLVVPGAPPAAAAEPFDSAVRSAISGLPYYGQSDVAAATITTPLKWQYSVKDPPNVVPTSVGTPAPTTFRAYWTITAGYPANEIAALRSRYQSSYCSKAGVFTLAVQDGAFGPQTCVGASGFGGAVDINQAADPYAGYANAYRIGTCWTASVGIAVTLLSPVSHGARNKPGVIEAMRVGADYWVRDVMNRLAPALDRGCGATAAPATTRPAPPPTTRPPTTVAPTRPATTAAPTPTTVRPTARFAIAALDASPSEVQGRSLRTLAPYLDTSRVGTTADGASKLLLRVTVPTVMSSVGCEVVRGGGTCKPLGQDVALADTWNLVYKPPKAFGPGTTWREVPVVVTATPESGDPIVATYAVHLYRPPVVLVHGLLSSPAVWGSSDRGMIQALTGAGYRVSTADYSRTTDQSFVVNAPKVAEAVQASVEAVRATDNVAVTKADVVGHSMGGILARIAAQPSLGAPVHRIITVCTPHHGSDLARVGRLVRGLDLSPLGSTAGLVSTALAMADWWFNAGLGREEGAVADLSPLSRSLRGVGVTKVGAHAITCIADNATIAVDPVFSRLYDVVGVAFFENEGEVLDQVLDPAHTGQNENAERLFRILEDAYERSLDPGTPPGETGFFTVSDPNLRAQAHQILRAAIFGNQPSDGVIRVESQAGGLPATAQSRVSGVVHTGAPSSPSVQLAVRTALADPYGPGAAGSKFAKSWPAAGASTTDLPPGVQTQPPEETLAAITASNIVGAHANAIADVADETNTIIVMRPVNPSAKPLIETGNATKGMRVKGKSSDWGPQNGYIAVDQLYSKLGSAARDAAVIQAIGKFDCEVEQSLDQGVAEARPLTLDRQGKTYTVLVASAAGSGPVESYGCRSNHGHPEPTAAFVQALTARLAPTGQPAVYLRDDAGTVLDAATLAPATVDAATLEPMLVLADPTSGLLLTADYDLLAIGTRTHDPKPSAPDPEMGFITSKQRALVRRLNAAVAATGYGGGRVVHHGPENQFDCSEKLDYPMTAFEPDGSVYSIDAGPSGAAQMPLKRYFERKNAEGWVISPNENWNWTRSTERQGAWEDADTRPEVPDSCRARTDDQDEIAA